MSCSPSLSRSLSKFMRPPTDVASTASHSSSWEFSSRTTEERPTHVEAPRTGVTTSGGWRKKTQIETNAGGVTFSGGWRKKTETDISSKTIVGKDVDKDKKLREVEKRTQDSSSESESSDNSDEEAVETIQSEPAVPDKQITEADLNALGAKILRAELMGSEVGPFGWVVNCY